MARIRALSSVARCMQRLGYLKYLARRVVALDTSSLNNLGKDLTQVAARRARVPLTPERVAYIRQRLFDRAYNGLKKQAAAWQEGDETLVSMELQDLYLADPSLPSQTGKLVQTDWRRYPPLGLGLGLIRAGTYSPTTRAMSLLHLTPDAELQAFLDYRPESNPLRLDRAQGLLFLYALLENDGEVVAPLLSGLASMPTDEFSDREAGDFLPGIYRALVKRHRARMLTLDDRETMERLASTADKIEKWQGKEYTGGGARENSIRVRLEPYAEIGLLHKPDPGRYGYRFAPAGRIWGDVLRGIESDAQVEEFLGTRFFTTAAAAWGIAAIPLADDGIEGIVPYLREAWEPIRSAVGYAPIEEIAILAGIRALLDDRRLIEPATARQAILAYQKAYPYEVRFTVNRQGHLAHARFADKTAMRLAEGPPGDEPPPTADD